MSIKYVGERPIISQYGVSFKPEKDDKYIYIKNAIHILHIIDSRYKQEYDSDIEDSQILKVIKEYEPCINEKVKEERVKYEEKLQNEIEKVKQKSNLEELEKKAWINNLELMKEYRIQRAINKIYYEHVLIDIEIIIKQEKIETIITPFNKRYLHVFKSLARGLENSKNHFRTKIETETINDKIVLKFKICR